MTLLINMPTLQNAIDHDLTGVVFGFMLGFRLFFNCHTIKCSCKIYAFMIMTWKNPLITSWLTTSSCQTYFCLSLRPV
ncbi:hypothetical protein VP01_1720g3 [Puccinia sorghi]|uniref:Uncharacterized protein n=1 Tax=Puccinia sorghi TaxID=27349 RepID=A0A0L6VHA3_9BASI|nr:hypothetical protein VP01_1720g3 [Puccinia sorghi]